MPKEIKDVREFISHLWKPGVKYITIHKKNVPVTSSSGKKSSSTGSKQIVKFKLRCARYLYTLTVDNRDKALKLTNSLPANLIRHTDNKKKTKST